MKDFFRKHDNIKAICFYALLTIILTWPVLAHFTSSVPSSGSDTLQVIGAAGIQANEFHDLGIFRGTSDLLKHSNFNILALYAYFQLIFGRVIGYNLLFYFSFILSGFGVYLLAYYFVKNKKAAFLAGVIYAFAPFHVHNAISTNVGTMHQEWLPFFVLYLFKFFEKFNLKYFLATVAFLFLIGFTEQQLLAFTAIFILFFFTYKLITEPNKFLDRKLWLYLLAAVIFFSIAFFLIFGNLLLIADSDNNFLDAGLKSAVKYSNDSLSIFVTPSFHTIWPNAFQNLREQFERKSSSIFSVYAGYSVLLFSLLGLVFWKYMKNRGQAVKGIFFWLLVALGFYILSWGPYLHFKGVIDPPIKMPYYLIYQYLPFYNNIRTVGRLFVYSMLAFSLLAAWGMASLELKILNLAFRQAGFKFKKKENKSEERDEAKGLDPNNKNNIRSLIFYSVVSLVIIIEFLALPLKMNSLLHSSFYEKLGQDKENYSVLEIPGSTDYGFASRDLVWKSIHRKNTINGYDFTRINSEGYIFQQGTPIIRTLLYDIPEGSDNKSDKDIMSSSYYKISNQILTYYNIRYIILDHEGLRGDPAKGNLDQFYTAKAYIRNVITCASDYEDEFLYACEVEHSTAPTDMFFAVDYSNPHWITRKNGKNGIQRFADSGAGLKLVNMSYSPQSSKIIFSAKLSKPLNLKVFLNGQVVFDKYLTQLSGRIDIKTDSAAVNPGQNDVIFDIRGADGAEIISDKKSDTIAIYNVDTN
jgi:hypothetical protein